MNNLRKEYKEKTGVDVDRIKKDIMVKHCADNGLIPMALGTSILNAMDEYAKLYHTTHLENLEQPRVRLETIDNIIQQWLKSDNENTTHCADLITKALSQPPTETEKEGL